MAKRPFACWCLFIALWVPGGVVGAPSVPVAPASAAASAAEPVTTRVRVPRIADRLRARDIGLVINTQDPYSVEVGEYYAARRGLTPAQVLRLALPTADALTDAEFHELRQAIDEHFGPAVQALALAWVSPWAVGCNALTGALALGLDEALCQRSCAPSRPSAYFNAPSARPFSELGLRPAMQIAAPSVAQARELVDRGVAADGSLARRGAPPATALFVTTGDKARNVRAASYPPAGNVAASGLQIAVEPAEGLHDRERLVVVQTGAASVPQLDTLRWLPGALADHLTSFGGRLTDPRGQMSALAWIGSGATASHGAASEPCNHLQKFPNPLLLLAYYAQGSSAIEAYWRSVAWPQQSVFIGEPLAAPFARRP